MQEPSRMFFKLINEYHENVWVGERITTQASGCSSRLCAVHTSASVAQNNIFSLPPFTVTAQGRFTYWRKKIKGSQDVFELNCFMCFLNILVWDICLCLKAHLFISTTVYIESWETDSHRCCMTWVFNTIHFEEMWHSFLAHSFPQSS